MTSPRSLHWCFSEMGLLPDSPSQCSVIHHWSGFLDEICEFETTQCPGAICPSNAFPTQRGVCVCVCVTFFI